MRRVSGRLSTLPLAPAWPGPRGRKFSPALAPSCPPSRSLLHNSPLTLHVRRHWEHLTPTSHSQMFTLLLRTPKFASGLEGFLQLCSTALDSRFSRSLRPCRALATRLPASATAPPRGLSLLLATSTAEEPLAGCKTQAEPTKCLCTHDPRTSSQHTSSPFSKKQSQHVHPRRTTQTLTDAQHMSNHHTSQNQ